MKLSLITLFITLAIWMGFTFFSSKNVSAGNGSEACVTHCTDAATDHYEYGTKEWSAFFNGCMRTCWL